MFKRDSVSRARRALREGLGREIAPDARRLLLDAVCGQVDAVDLLGSNFKIEYATALLQESPSLTDAELEKLYRDGSYANFLIGKSGRRVLPERAAYYRAVRIAVLLPSGRVWEKEEGTLPGRLKEIVSVMAEAMDEPQVGRVEHHAGQGDIKDPRAVMDLADGLYDMNEAELEIFKVLSGEQEKTVSGQLEALRRHAEAVSNL